MKILVTALILSFALAACDGGNVDVTAVSAMSTQETLNSARIETSKQLRGLPAEDQIIILDENYLLISDRYNVSLNNILPTKNGLVKVDEIDNQSPKDYKRVKYSIPRLSEVFSELSINGPLDLSLATIDKTSLAKAGNCLSVGAIGYLDKPTNKLYNGLEIGFSNCTADVLPVGITAGSVKILGNNIKIKANRNDESIVLSGEIRAVVDIGFGIGGEVDQQKILKLPLKLKFPITAAGGAFSITIPSYLYVSVGSNSTVGFKVAVDRSFIADNTGFTVDRNGFSRIGEDPRIVNNQESPQSASAEFFKPAFNTVEVSANTIVSLGVGLETVELGPVASALPLVAVVFGAGTGLNLAGEVSEPCFDFSASTIAKIFAFYGDEPRYDQKKKNYVDLYNFRESPFFTTKIDNPLVSGKCGEKLAIPIVREINPVSMKGNDRFQPLSISGENFSSGNVVQTKRGTGSNSAVWNTTSNTPNIVSDKSIIVDINPGSSNDTINVRVCRASSQVADSDCSSGTHFVTVVQETPPTPVPVVESLSPSSMPADGEQHLLTIRGSRFQGGNVVQTKYGAGDGANVWNITRSGASVDSDTQITVSINPGRVSDTIYVRVCRSSSQAADADCSSGTHSIAVTEAGTTTPVPTVSFISPTSMTADNMQHLLTISGDGLRAGNVVQIKYGVGANANVWNNTNNPPTINSASQVSVSINPGSVDDTLYVRVCRSASQTANSDCSSGMHSITVTRASSTAPVPVINSISPTSMVADNAQHLLTINGASFQAGNIVQVKYGAGAGANVWNNTNNAPNINSANQITVSINPGAVNDTIYVRVCRSASQTADTDCSSGMQSIAVTQVRGLSTPALTAPADGSMAVPVNPTFEWTAVSDAQSYQIMVATDLAFLPADSSTETCEKCSINKTVSTPIYSAEALAVNQDYYWQVRASPASNDSRYRSSSWSRIFQFKTVTGTISAPRISRVSVGSAGTEGNEGAGRGVMSENGRYVAFESSASNLIQNDSNDVTQDIFLRDRDSDANGIFDEPNGVRTSLISVSAIGVQGNDKSYSPSISSSGRFISFTSWASNLVSGDTNSKADVFVYDRDADGNGVFDELNKISIVRVSLNVDGSQSTKDAASSKQALSADGRFVTFLLGTTEAVFVRDRNPDSAGTYDLSGRAFTVKISGESSASGVAIEPIISATGRFVVTSEVFSEMTQQGIFGNFQIFVHDRDLDGNSIFDESGGTSSTRYPGIFSGDSRTIAIPSEISSNGRFVIFMDNYASGNPEYYGQLIDRDSDVNGVFDEPEKTKVSLLRQNNLAYAPSMSKDGRFIAFELRSGTGASSSDIYLMDRDSDNDGIYVEPSVAPAKLISRSPKSQEQGNLMSFTPFVSGNGRFIGFMSSADNLVNNDRNSSNDLFVVDVTQVP